MSHDGDELTVRLRGADHAPLVDRYDLDVVTVPQNTVIVQASDCVGVVVVEGIYPAQTYRVTVYPLRHRPVSQFVVGCREVTFHCPVIPQRVTSVEWGSPDPELVRIVDVCRLEALSPLERAGLLNIFAKLTAAGLWPYVIAVDGTRGDRIFATVDAELFTRLQTSADWDAVSGALHTPPDGFTRLGSFKENTVETGVLQVTLFTNGADMRADIDIDDAGGLGHVFQVLDHWITNGHTHPYDIHQILTFSHGMNPGYRLVV